MKVTIHRGTNQIGGIVTEIISSKGTRIFIDMGSQLPGSKDVTEVDILGVTSGEKDCDAVLFTHYHGDHIGLIGTIIEEIPLYLGVASKEIALVVSRKLEEVASREPAQREVEQAHHQKTVALERCRPCTHGEVITIKDMKITPFSVDHSAFDAYMFLIECDGNRVLYTGDFRLHGYGAERMWKTLKEISEVDYLISEGTTINRIIDGKTITEAEVSEKAEEELKRNEYNFVMCSSTNIDHIAGFYRAMPEGMSMVCDQYQKDILDVVAKYSKDSFYQFQGKPILIRGNRADGIPYEFNGKLREKVGKFCAFVRPTKYLVKDKAFMESAHVDSVRLFYGLWSGYLKGEHADPNVVAVAKQFKQKMMPLHSSGHVLPEDLVKVVENLKPKKGIIPIHTETPDKFEELFDGSGFEVIPLGDKVELELK